MESKERKPRGRPRKRKRTEDEDVSTDTKSASAKDKRRAVVFVETKPIPLVGRYVLKEFDGNGIYLGKIVYYDSGLYRVEYEDGDCEDLESSELRAFLLREDDFDKDLRRRKKKLDDVVSKKGVNKKKGGLEKKDGDLESEVERVEMPTLSELSGELTVKDDGEQIEGDLDSSTDSCENAEDVDADLEAEAPIVPPLQLPPSSGTIGVPEECVSHLFSVYGFLRSFSIRLFLSPFGLDDFVGSLNCLVPNTLLDAIHVALLRVLKRHLETLSSDGSEQASNCLRCIDWSLLDTMTWPVYIVHYLTLLGYIKGPEWKGFYDEVLDREYYSLSASRKLMILQILCDDALESEELRAEIDMREASEVGIDPDAVATNAPENGPRRVHPRYSKTSACRDREAVETITQREAMKSSCKAKTLGFKGTEGDVNASDVDIDGNGDECQICGMDGTLLCCDGCPSAYHSRCIGVAKMYIPEGSWYCPECLINKISPALTMGTSLTGAEIFGIDLYEQVFLGSFNYLLVLKASTNTEPYVRYYNFNDIPKVVRVLLSSVQHIPVYLGMCKAVLKYWGMPESAFSLDLIEKRSNVTNMVGAENTSSKRESNVDNKVAVSSLDAAANAMSQTDLPVAQRNDVTVTERTQDCLVLNVKLPGQMKMESALSTGSISHQADPSDVTHQSFVDRSSALDLMTCTSGISNVSCGGQASSCLPANALCLSKEGNRADLGRSARSSADNCVYMGSFFKPQAYINQYMHGDFAASAAANLAVLSSEESQVSEAQKSGSTRRAISGSILLQTKAFSSAASRFFWPYSEKKLWEVPRERCGWCFSCKAPPSNRRGCMLNSAIIVSTKSAMKILNGLNPPKTGEGNLPTILTYILYMEESLRGLIGGPFRSATYRKKWRKQAEEASTFNSIKSLLLELEENACLIALSGDWVKLLDDWVGEFSVIQSASCNVGTTQKRGPSGKRGKKQAGIFEVTAGGCSDQSFFSWWQGGNSTKLIFQKASLPHSIVRKAARQGGVIKNSAINYADGSEIPKISRKLVWRAAVERCKNASQLSLQVRYLDLHLRWSDLVRPEQNLQDGKGPETEASAFRNATICDKKIEENKIRYGIIFGNQKHLPSRVMKSIIEVEPSQDGKEKFWFSETRIPLYLIKEYEERIDQVMLQSAVKKSSNELSKLQKKQLKASRRDIFSFLVSKRDRLEKCACASCQLDVLLGNAVKCNACRGYCHEDCTLRSEYMNDEKPFATCKHCYFAKALAPSEISSESPTSPLPLHREEYNTAVTATKGSRPKGSNKQLAYVRTRESSEMKQKTRVCSEVKQKSRRSSEMKQKTSDSSLVTKVRIRTLTCGVIWRKKNNEDTGAEFRLANILLKGSSDAHHLGPVCELCKQPYNSDLMYIHCETCQKWFHAEAVELDESKLSDVLGFKCCRCRRIAGPLCPYMDPKLKVEKVKKQRMRTQKPGQVTTKEESDSGTISESMECTPATPMFPKEEVFVPEEDPLLFSLSKVELITDLKPEVDFEWNTASAPGPQKLPVRRQVKCEGDVGGGFDGNNLPHAEFSTRSDTNKVMNPKDVASVPCVEWDPSSNGLEGGTLFDYEGISYEDMEFEPQTYFSFSELLASDEGCQLDGIDASGMVLGNLEEYGMGTSNDQLEHKIPTVNPVHCRMCQDTELAPELSCQVCGLSIHNHCSPWEESSPMEGSWRCGKCRDWR